MSRIYEALKQSEKDTASTLLPIDNEPVAPAVEPIVATDPSEPVTTEFLPVAGEECLTVVPNPNKPLVALSDEHSLAGEKFRILGNRLAYVRRSQDLKLVQITSGVAGEGKSVIAANLSVMLSRRNQERVLLIEGDVHRPTQMSLFGIGRRSGLGEWWEHPSEELPRFYRINDLRLWLLPAGVTHHPSEMLQSGRLPNLLKDLRQMFDWVIIDSPPMLPLADTNLWARWADGTLLVVREGVTPRRALQRGLDSMDNPKIIGIVLNEASEGNRVHYYDQYYHAKKSEKTASDGSATSQQTETEKRA